MEMALFCVLSNKPILEISIAERIKQQIEDGKFVEATDSWGELENVIATSSNNVVLWSSFNIFLIEFPL